MRASLLSVALLLLTIAPAGCGGLAHDGDAAAADDSGGVGDAGDVDASVDAARDADAAGSEDGGPVEDAALALDGALGDGGADARTDAGTDSGTDAGSDAGTDAGSDAGSDAGATTTCSITVTPPTGATTDTFDFTAASNGSGCAVRLDGGPTAGTPCDAAMSVGGSTFGAGSHTVELLVGDGPSGPTSCSASFTVTDPGSTTTTCSLSVEPPFGATTDTFDFTAASNGSACTVRLDGGTPLATPCNGFMSMAGSSFGLGPHTIELLVGDGPSGPTTCSASFTVTGPGATTACSISVDPEAGSASTTFTATFSSDGSGCTLSVDAFSLGSVPCTSTYSGMGGLVGTGTHTATLSVGAGPGGPTSCSDTFVVTP